MVEGEEVDDMMLSEMMEKLCKVILIMFFILYLLIATLTPPGGEGELSSFEIPVISLLEHGSFEAKESDYQLALQWFSPHKNVMEFQYKVFPFDGEGHRYPWYFGLYAPLCIPVFVLLKVLHLNTVFTLPVTNAFCLAAALWGIYRYWKVDIKQRLFAILFLGMGEMSLWNEITTESYEVAMSALTIMTAVFWLNRERKKAAFFLSLAGTMNPTVMAFGVFMIIDYFCEIFTSADKSWTRFAKNCKEKWKDLLVFSLCFLPCLIPMAFTYKLFGHVSTQSSLGKLEGIGERFFAYLFDLNFGIFPYLPLLLPLFAFVCLRSREIWLKWTFIGVVATIFSYSLHFHINCGMPGIHRYNEWLLPLIILPTIAYLHVVVPSIVSRNAIWGIKAVSFLWCASIMGISLRTPYVFWLPLARAVMDHAPYLYNPLPSTFNSRTSHIDGGYEIKGPVIYSAQDGYARKILIPPGMVEHVRTFLYIPPKLEDSVTRQLEQAKSAKEFTYLNFPGTAQVLTGPSYTLGQEVFFDGTEKDGHRYFLKGLGTTEKDFVWTEGTEAQLRARFPEPITQDILLSIRIREVFYRPQRLIAFCGKQVVFDQTITNQEQVLAINIPKECVLGGRILDVSFQFPDAAIPSQVMVSQDRRELAFAVTSFSISLQKRGE